MHIIVSGIYWCRCWRQRQRRPRALALKRRGGADGRRVRDAKWCADGRKITIIQNRLAIVLGLFTGMYIFWSDVLAAKSQNKFPSKMNVLNFNKFDCSSPWNPFLHIHRSNKTMDASETPGFMKNKFCGKRELTNASLLARPWPSHMLQISRAPRIPYACKLQPYKCCFWGEISKFKTLPYQIPSSLGSLNFPKRTFPRLNRFQ